MFLPPFAVPPSSITWNFRDANPLPNSCAPGVNTSLPMSPTSITWPAPTAFPASVSAPVAGREAILTARNASPSILSEKPKSPALKP